MTSLLDTGLNMLSFVVTSAGLFIDAIAMVWCSVGKKLCHEDKTFAILRSFSIVMQHGGYLQKTVLNHMCQVKLHTPAH